MAVALAPEVLVNCVAPGLLEGTRATAKLRPEAVEINKKASLLGVAADKDDCADQVVTMCKTNTTTGQTLVIDSGRTFHDDPQRRALLRVPARAAVALARRPRGHQAIGERLADYALARQIRRLDAATVEQAKSLIVDSMACRVAAFDDSGPSALPRPRAGAGRRRVDRDRHDAPDHARPRLLRQWRGHPLLRPQTNAYASAGSGAVHPSDHIVPVSPWRRRESERRRRRSPRSCWPHEINCRLIDATDSVPKGWDPRSYSLPAVALAAAS